MFVQGGLKLLPILFYSEHLFPVTPFHDISMGAILVNKPGKGGDLSKTLIFKE